MLAKREGKTMIKMLNKETITFVLGNKFAFSGQLLNEIVETIWNSDNLLEEKQKKKGRNSNSKD